MCLVFRAIVLLSLNWWIVSVVAQEKQGVTTTSSTALSQIDPAIQAQQSSQDNNVKAEQKSAVQPSSESKKEEKKPTEIKKEDSTPPVKNEAVQPSSENKKEEKKPAEVKKEELTPPVKNEVAQPSSENKKEEKKSAEVKKEEPKPTVKSKTLESEDAEIKGIDTVDLEEPRGNWLFKRIWWNRAENKYEKIRQLFGNILESRILFFTKRSKVDKDLFAPFYFEMGMSNGELQETVSQLLKYIENERKKSGELSGSAREIFNVLMREKKSLESINADVLTINKLDVDIDETVKKLMEQIDRARKYEREAWNSFKDIAHVLSDKKARELFYQMDTAHNNLKDIQEYVGQALSVHLDRVMGMAKSQIERIKATIDKLKKEGNDLKTLADKASGKIPAKPTPVKEEEVEQEEEEEELGFFARTVSAIKSGFVAIWDSVVYVVTLPFSWFSSSESSGEEVASE